MASAGAAADDLARGDRAWANRAVGEREGTPPTGPIFDAVRSYELALDGSPHSLEARWKLLRALHFAGEFALPEEREQLQLLERAREVSEEGLDLLADRLGAGVRLEALDPGTLQARLEAENVASSEVARLYFWSAINWGAWSRRVGILRAVRQGVANKVHQYVWVTMSLEPEYEEGGAFRLLGRLHAAVPRLPFVSGWVDRDEAIPLLERAYAIAPANPGNRLLLGLTLLELAPDRRREALALLEQVQRLTPRPSMRIEDLAMREQSRERLSAARGQST